MSNGVPTFPTNPVALLKGAIKSVPAVRYALGVVGIAAAVAIILGIIRDPKIAFFGITIMLALMFILVIFAYAARSIPGIRWLAALLAWTIALLFIATLIATFTSFVFGVPRTFAQYLTRTPTTPLEPLLKLTETNLYRDTYTKGGTWALYKPELHGREQYWIGAIAKASKDVIIDKVSVGYKNFDRFVVGYTAKEQQNGDVDKYELDEGKSAWISVQAEENIWDEMAGILSNKTTLKIYTSDGKEIASTEIGPIPSLIFNPKVVLVESESRGPVVELMHNELADTNQVDVTDRPQYSEDGWIKQAKQIANEHPSLLIAHWHSLRPEGAATNIELNHRAENKLLEGIYEIAAISPSTKFLLYSSSFAKGREEQDSKLDISRAAQRVSRNDESLQKSYNALLERINILPWPLHITDGDKARLTRKVRRILGIEKEQNAK